MAISTDIAHRINLKIVQDETLDAKQYRAQIRDIFYEQDNFAIQGILKQDLKRYVDIKDIDKMRFITIDFFISAFLEKLCNVYDTPPVWKFKDKESKEAQRLLSLFSEINILQLMHENHCLMRLHNTILNYVRYNSEVDRIYVQNKYNVGTCRIWSYDTFYQEPKIFGYPFIEENNEIRWYIWNRELKEHYYIIDVPKYDYDTKDLTNIKHKISEKDSDIFFPHYFPVVKYQYKDQNEFWGNGLDAIIELIRSVNVLLTICNDDTILETMRILILNFDLMGNKGQTENIEGSREEHIKTGLRHPVYVKNKLSGEGENIDAQILSAPLFNEEILTFINNLTDIISSLHNIDNIIKTELKQDLSGIALRLRNEPLIRQWQKDINILRYADIKLIETLIKVNNYHRQDSKEKQIKENILDGFSIDYQEPKVVTDEKEDYELARQQWQDGTENIIEWVIKHNPTFDEKQAREYIEKNRKDFEELTGMTANVNMDTGNED